MESYNNRMCLSSWHARRTTLDLSHVNRDNSRRSLTQQSTFTYKIAKDIQTLNKIYVKNVMKMDIVTVVNDAKKIGVKHCIVVPEFVSEFQDVLDLCNQFPGFCFPCLGVHPCQGSFKHPESINDKHIKQALPMIEKHHNNLVAIGEVGLDFRQYYANTPELRNQQKQCLRTWVQIAKKYKLPLNIHSRSAGRPALQLLKEEGLASPIGTRVIHILGSIHVVIDAANVLMHAFDGRPALALEACRRPGMYFSISPIVVRDDQTKKLIKLLPIERLILETDSPALSPVKQERNTPANIIIACEEIARIKELPMEKVTEILWDNTMKLFPRLATIKKL